MRKTFCNSNRPKKGGSGDCWLILSWGEKAYKAMTLKTPRLLIFFSQSKRVICDLKLKEAPHGIMGRREAKRE